MNTLTRQLRPTAPYDFALTAAYHAYFQERSGADTFANGVYRRLLDLDGRLALASVRDTGRPDSPQLTLELRGPALAPPDIQRAADQIARMLGITQDQAPFYAQAQSDPVLPSLIRQFHGLHLPCAATLFESLVFAVLGQQISARVARMMRMLLIQHYGAQMQFDGETYYAFPRPEAILESSPEELRGLKLTQRKAEYIHGIAAAALTPDWPDPDQLPDAEIVRRLTALRGIGHWTAQWALLRGLARPDALPLGDLALRRAVSRLWRNNEPTTDAQVAALAENWRPWRSYATAYLFAAMRTGMV